MKRFSEKYALKKYDSKQCTPRKYGVFAYDPLGQVFMIPRECTFGFDALLRKKETRSADRAVFVADLTAKEQKELIGKGVITVEEVQVKTKVDTPWIFPKSKRRVTKNRVRTNPRKDFPYHAETKWECAFRAFRNLAQVDIRVLHARKEVRIYERFVEEKYVGLDSKIYRNFYLVVLFRAVQRGNGWWSLEELVKKDVLNETKIQWIKNVLEQENVMFPRFRSKAEKNRLNWFRKKWSVIVEHARWIRDQKPSTEWLEEEIKRTHRNPKTILLAENVRALVMLDDLYLFTIQTYADLDKAFFRENALVLRSLFYFHCK